jgi:2-oxoglutarate dehydrogenase E1 component
VLQVEVAAAHRGRLSLLVNLLGKPLGALCSEMEGKQSDFRVGDVKYHLGEDQASRGVAVGATLCLFLQDSSVASGCCPS